MIAMHLVSPRLSATMLSLVSLLITSVIRSTDGAFLLPSQPIACRHSFSAAPSSVLAATAGETEAETLLRKARELAAQAAAAEESLRAELCDKKEKLDKETDAFVNRIFPQAGDGFSGLVDRLRAERPSTDMLRRVIERLHEREIAAQGLQHVESSSDVDHTKFEVVAERDEEEMKRVEGLIDQIIDAAAALDKERMEAKLKRGEGGVRHHAEVMHWTEGDVAKVLRDKVARMRREHDEQFQKRLQSFYDAAKKKDQKKAP